MSTFTQESLVHLLTNLRVTRGSSNLSRHSAFLPFPPYTLLVNKKVRLQGLYFQYPVCATAPGFSTPMPTGTEINIARFLCPSYRDHRMKTFPPLIRLMGGSSDVLSKCELEGVGVFYVGRGLILNEEFAPYIVFYNTRTWANMTSSVASPERTLDVVVSPLVFLETNSVTRFIINRIIPTLLEPSMRESLHVHLSIEEDTSIIPSSRRAAAPIARATSLADTLIVNIINSVECGRSPIIETPQR